MQQHPECSFSEKISPSSFLKSGKHASMTWNDSFSEVWLRTLLRSTKPKL